jgi:hypothetical protein
LLADALTLRGLQVLHILRGSSVVAHALHEFARVQDGKLVYPGLV